MSTPAHAQGHPGADAAEVLDSSRPVLKRRMLLIVNPHATAVSESLREMVVFALQNRFEVHAVDTKAPGHGTELCRQAAHEGYDVIVAFGGDGTVNEAANGLLGSSTPLCCLPGGAANVFAKMLGLPSDLIDATERLLAMADDWHPRRVDLGNVNGRCFTFNSGVGLDASVVERVDSNPHMKARLGPYYFAWVAVATFLRRYLLKPPRMRTATGRETLEGVTTIVQNGTPFTYFNDRPVEVAEDVTLDSGALACCVLHRATPLDMPMIAWRALSRRARIVRHRQVTGLSKLSELTVTTADGRPLPLQVDGDYLGDVAEARYSIIPSGLSIIS